jgi:hypothetical protein
MRRVSIIGWPSALLIAPVLMIGAMSGSALAAGCGDPWVTAAVTTYHGAPASPSAPECNINTYLGGKWSSQPELNAAVATYFHPGRCSDPWVAQAAAKYLRHEQASAQAFECKIGLYRGGQWNSYADLDVSVQAFWSVNPYPSAAVLAFPSGMLNGQLAFLKPDGHLVSAGGGNLVAAGGGNLVAAGGGNLVSAGGGNLTGKIVSTNGGNFVLH